MNEKIRNFMTYPIRGRIYTNPEINLHIILLCEYLSEIMNELADKGEKG